MTDSTEISYAEYIQSEAWVRKAEEAKRRAGHRCQICNRHQDDVLIDAHHRTYERLGNERPEDIPVLCRECHDLFSRHAKLAKYGFQEFRQLDSGKPRRIPDILSESAMAQDQVLTGFLDLDRLINGLPASSLTVISSTPGMGKTWLSAALVSRIARRNRQVAVFSLQLSAAEFANRLLALEAGSRPIPSQQLDETEIDRPHQELASLAQSDNILIDDTPALTLAGLRLKCYEIGAKQKLDLILVDGLEMMVSDDIQDSPWRQITAIMRSTKQLARELNVPVVVTWPVERSRRQDPRPVLEDLPDSMQQVSDVVTFLMRDLEDEVSCSELIVAKNRRGPCDTVYIALRPEIPMVSDLLRFSPDYFDESEPL